jgi:butyryl-CoA dehydrogenase
MGIRGSHTGELVLQNVRIPKENLLGQLGKGLHIALETLDSGRIGVAANSIGLAKRALDEAVKYSKERVQFGKPICQNQAIAFMLADMETRLTAARLMTYDAAMKKQAKEPYAHEAAMAKYYASEAANYIADRAVQIHGGYGYTKDYVVERLFRDARILSIYEGTSEVQKIVISNHIIKRK